MRQEHKAEMKARKRNVRLLVAYDGTNYHGFQYQNPPVIAVQNVLEEVLEKITQTDKKKLSDSEKTDLDRLTQELNDIDSVIGNILNGRL